MAENEPEVKVFPGVTDGLDGTGITPDASNVWMNPSLKASSGHFDEIEPVKHYAEHYQDKDRFYQEHGKPGLLKAVMAGSNPEVVAAFDQLVDEFNTDLPRIIEQRDGVAVQGFLKRSTTLNPKSTKEQDLK